MNITHVYTHIYNSILIVSWQIVFWTYKKHNSFVHVVIVILTACLNKSNPGGVKSQPNMIELWTVEYNDIEISGWGNGASVSGF